MAGKELENKTEEFLWLYESRLMSLAKSGDNTAFAEIYQRYEPIIFRLNRRKTLCLQDAQDLTSQTFLEAFENLQQYEDRGKRPIVWFYTISYNHVLEFWREKRAHTLFTTSPYNDITIRPSGEILIYADPHYSPIPGQEPEETPIAQENVYRFRKAVNMLPEKQQDAIYYKNYTGLTHSQIALAMGNTEGAVKQLLFRARKTLKVVLRPARAES